MEIQSKAIAKVYIYLGSQEAKSYFFLELNTCI